VCFEEQIYLAKGVLFMAICAADLADSDLYLAMYASNLAMNIE
jgi:hypothetical protein